MTYGITWGEGDGPINTIQVEATGTSGMNLNDSLPAAPSTGNNIRFQIDTGTTPANVSANVRVDTPGLTLSTTNAIGSATSVIRADATVAVFDTTVPAILTANSSGSTGSAGKAARRDHRHEIETDTPAFVWVNTGSEFVGNSLALVTANSNVALFDDSGSAANLAGTAADGTAAWAARRDHVHKSQTSGDFYAETTGKGLVTKDTQGTPRYWRVFVKEGASTPASGGCTITISSTGVITATRDGGAAGDIVIRIDDTGTSAP